MGSISFIYIVGLLLCIIGSLFIEPFVEGFESSHLADYSPNYVNMTPDYTVNDIRFAGTATPTGTARPTGTATPTGTSRPTGTATPTRMRDFFSTLM